MMSKLQFNFEGVQKNPTMALDTRIPLKLNLALLCTCLVIYSWFTSVPSFLLSGIRCDVMFVALTSFAWTLVYLYHDLRSKDRILVLFSTPQSWNTYQPTSVPVTAPEQAQDKNDIIQKKTLHNSETNGGGFLQCQNSGVTVFTFICHILLIFCNINQMESFLRNLLFPRIPCDNSIPFHLSRFEKLFLIVLPLIVIIINVSSAVVHIIGGIINKPVEADEPMSTIMDQV